MSSSSNLRATSSNGHQDFSDADGDTAHIVRSSREVFKWAPLRNISQHLYTTKLPKASSVLGVSPLGSPTVLVANGLICVGTDEGRICVYDFKQTFKCVCGSDPSGSSFLGRLVLSSDITSTAKAVGPVTALALSHDHTYVASGHSTGHIQLFDLKNPQSPVRSVTPTTLAVVASGRKEGHLQGSRIVNIGFIAGRHTAIVSADEHGLAFYHSLGKVLFVEASDILRILGKYPEANTLPAPQTVVSSSVSRSGALAIPNPSISRRRKSRYTILAMIPLPLGTSPHATDAYNVIALLTPTKLVVVALKPTPKTWFKCPREVDEGGSWKSRSKWKGTMAWFPSVVLPSSGEPDQVNHHDKKNRVTSTTPMLVFTWGSSVHLIRVSELRTKQMLRSSKTGKPGEVEVGRIVYEDAGKWTVDSDVLAIQWLNANVGSFAPVFDGSDLGTQISDSK